MDRCCNWNNIGRLRLQIDSSLEYIFYLKSTFILVIELYDSLIIHESFSSLDDIIKHQITWGSAIFNTRIRKNKVYAQKLIFGFFITDKQSENFFPLMIVQDEWGRHNIKSCLLPGKICKSRIWISYIYDLIS